MSNKNKMLVLSLLVSTLSFTGCATLTTGTSQSIAVITEKGIDEASCELTDKKGRVYFS